MLYQKPRCVHRYSAIHLRRRQLSERALPWRSEYPVLPVRGLFCHRRGQPGQAANPAAGWRRLFLRPDRRLARASTHPPAGRAEADTSADAPADASTNPPELRVRRSGPARARPDPGTNSGAHGVRLRGAQPRPNRATSHTRGHHRHRRRAKRQYARQLASHAAHLAGPALGPNRKQDAGTAIENNGPIWATHCDTHHPITAPGFIGITGAYFQVDFDRGSTTAD